MVSLSLVGLTALTKRDSVSMNVASMLKVSFGAYCAMIPFAAVAHLAKLTRLDLVARAPFFLVGRPLRRQGWRLRKPRAQAVPATKRPILYTPDSRAMLVAATMSSFTV